MKGLSGFWLLVSFSLNGMRYKNGANFKKKTLEKSTLKPAYSSTLLESNKTVSHLGHSGR